MEPIEEAIARDPRIGEIFYFFEELTTLASGRTVGRKIGIVQEVILRWYLEQDEVLRRRMYLEQLLEGASGAAHKVEFSWFALRDAGGLNAGDELPGAGGLRVEAIDPPTERVRLSVPGAPRSAWLSVGSATPRTSPLRQHLDQHAIDLRVLSAAETVDIDVIDRSQLLASLESKRVGAQRFAGTDKLGSGIQTIEKAKQASLVAIDLDLRNNGSVKPLQTPGEKRALSFVALGNGVHWTEKDRAVLATYVDFTYIVNDAAIIRYAEYVREQVDEDEDFLEFFMSYFQGMTKQERDGFEVSDEDFSIVAPLGEDRSLRSVLADHVTRVNP